METKCDAEKQNIEQVNENESIDDFLVITDKDVEEADEEYVEELFKEQDESIEQVIDSIEDLDLSENDIKDVVTELRHLEEKLHLWREVRMTTIKELREVADYIDSVSKKTGIAKVGIPLFQEKVFIFYIIFAADESSSLGMKMKQAVAQHINTNL